MKSVRKLALISLLFLLIIISGCEVENNSSNTPPSSTYTDESSSTLPFDNPNTDEPENPYIDYLGSESLTKTAGYILYYGTYGQNATGKLINQQFVSKSELASKLTERIASDLSPDLCEKPENAYYLTAKNLFEDLTKYIDTSAPQWVEYSEYLETHKFNNGNYFYPTSIKQSPYFLAYKPYQIKDYTSSKTPTELWRDGAWDYEMFLYILNSFSGSSITAKYDSNAAFEFSNYRKSPMECLLISSGLPVVDIGSDGRYFSNLNNKDFSDKIISIGNLFSEPLRSFDDASNYCFISLNDKQLAQLRSSEESSERAEWERWAIVPYPTAADGRYYGITEGYLVPKRAKNIKAAASFINNSRITARLDDFPDSLTEEDRKILTELRKQSYSKMIESCGSYIDSNTKQEFDTLWRYGSYDDLDKDALTGYETTLSKPLTEINENIK